jgi:hypothetical protein
MGAIVRQPHRVRGLALAFGVCAALTVVAPWSPAADAAEPGPALLTAVDVQDMGTFDRVTFSFRTSMCIDSPCNVVNPVPAITHAEYVSRPVLADASGMEVPVAGNAVLRIAMSPASTVDGSVDPPVTTYAGATRIQPDLPSVVDVVETGDFEGVLSWAIGLRSGEVPASAVVLTDPTRVVVDIPHVVIAVVAAPSFTG